MNDTERAEFAEAEGRPPTAAEEDRVEQAWLEAELGGEA